MSSEGRPESFTESLGDLIPAETRQLVEGAVTWIRKHPAEAAAIGAAGGFLLGLTGFGRVYQGVKTVRAMPIVSQIVLGLVAKQFLGKEFGEEADSMH
jgi:hypothetical protein